MSFEYSKKRMSKYREWKSYLEHPGGVGGGEKRSLKMVMVLAMASKN
jgi:hypothetical protein